MRCDQHDWSAGHCQYLIATNDKDCFLHILLQVICQVPDVLLFLCNIITECLQVYTITTAKSMVMPYDDGLKLATFFGFCAIKRCYNRLR